MPLSQRRLSSGGRLASSRRRQNGDRCVVPIAGASLPGVREAARAAVRDGHRRLLASLGASAHRRCARQREPLVIYDAHNVESVLRYRLLADGEIGVRIVRNGTAAGVICAAGRISC